MKGGKEEESKAMGPLFPRLHVNDTNKGGPRAPPRNKMALYEQFSVPSQRPNSVSSNSNRPAQISGSLAPSASSNQGFGQEKPHFSSFNRSQQQPILNSSEKVNTNDSGSHASRRPMKLLRRESSVHSKRPQTISESSSARPTDQEPSRKNNNNRSPSRNSNQEPSRRNNNRSPSRNSNQEPSRRNNNRSPSRNSNQEPSRRYNNRSPSRNSNQEPSRRNNNRSPSRNSNQEPSRRNNNRSPSRNSNQEPSRRYNNRSPSRNSNQEPSRRNNNRSPSRNSNQEPSRRNNNRSPSRRNPNHREDDDFTVPTLLETGGKTGNKVVNSERESTGRNGNNSLNLNLEERESEEERENEEERDNDLSPDDVVGVIGPKLFLKTRRAIVHQQRIFAVQVFELHRLIKVQQLIAGSPHILLEDLSYLKKPSKPSPIPIPSTNNNLLPPPHEKPHSESPQQIPPKPPSPPKQSHVGSDMANNSATISAAPQEPINQATQSNTNPWYQPNQWLVPVMSPLEGLVYKPYSGPCPPAGSFMAPFFPSCPSVNTPAGGYGVPVQVPVPVPVPVQNVGNVGLVGLPNYFPPFGNMNVVNGNGNPNLNVIPNVSVSAVEQVSHLVLSNNNNNVPNRNNHNNNGNNNKNGNDNNNNDRNNREQNNSRSSCNMSQLNARRMRNCRESELQGSTASSPFEKSDNTNNKNTTTTNNNSGFGAQWFPMGMPGMEALANQNVTSGAVGSMPRVIRVVPHNARSATESVARIFQSIQKEKKQN